MKALHIITGIGVFFLVIAPMPSQSQPQAEPAQAVQTGPDNQFVYVVNDDRKVVAHPVTLAYVEEGLAVIDGIAPGARIVVEGAQNLRPGSIVSEAKRASPEAEQGEGKKADQMREQGKAS